MKEFIEKLISRLEELKTEAYDKWDGGASHRAYSNTIDIVNQLAEEYINCSTNTSSGWIPCSERLPENYGTYLCCDKYGNFILGYPIARVSSNNFYVETECEIMNDCIAWMPLPPTYVPKEGRE